MLLGPEQQGGKEVLGFCEGSNWVTFRTTEWFDLGGT